MMSTTMSAVITGLGAVTPYGKGVERLWQALMRGESAISGMDLFELGGIACTRAGVVRGYVPPAGFENAPRASGFASGACREALDQAGILNDAAACAETALITASNFADMDAGEKALIPVGCEGREGGQAIHCLHAAPAAAIADGFGLGGIRLPLSLSCASGAAAIACAGDLLLAGRARRVLVVGYDALSRFAWSGLCSLRTMTRDEVRPFDRARSGTIFTEGAAALVIERADVCAARGGKPLCCLFGWATGNNGHHMTAPAPRGAGSAWVMRQALALAKMGVEAVDHINAHGTGTKANDTTEAQAIHDVFGPCAASIPVTSVKGLLGHMLGAAGSVEAVIAVLTMLRGIVPPTGNLLERDPDCDLDVVTVAREWPTRCVLSNSAGFGGCNTAIVLTREPLPQATPVTRRDKVAVAITGVGLVSALGADPEECAVAFREGEPACFPLSRLTVPDAAEPPLAGEAPSPDLAAVGVVPKPYLDRASELFLAACGQALRQAGLDAGQAAGIGAGIMAGTAWGGCGTAEAFFADYMRKGPRLVKPFLFPHAYANTAVSLAAMEWGLTGAHGNFVSPGTASGLALVQAFDALQSGQAHAILAGGTEALSATRLTAGERQAVAGEAAAVAVLEREETVTVRGAAVLGRILGCGLAGACEPAVVAALVQAGADRPAAIYADCATASAAERLFGGDVPVVVPERLCGEAQGAAGGLLLVLALMTGTDGPFIVLVSEARTCVALVVESVRPSLRG